MGSTSLLLVTSLHTDLVEIRSTLATSKTVISGGMSAFESSDSFGIVGLIRKDPLAGR